MKSSISLDLEASSGLCIRGGNVHLSPEIQEASELASPFPYDSTYIANQLAYYQRNLRLHTELPEDNQPEWVASAMISVADRLELCDKIFSGLAAYMVEEGMIAHLESNQTIQ